MDLDLRKLRYFVAVADLLHFGRAAAALYITQPALSRQIRQFEEELGVELLERSSRQVSLTPAGKRLAEDGARLLADSEAAVARAALHRAGDGDRRLLVPVVRFRRLDRLSAPLCSVLSAPRHARDHRVLRLTSMHHLPVGKPRPRRDRPARSRRGITDHRCHGTARPARGARLTMVSSGLGSRRSRPDCPSGWEDPSCMPRLSLRAPPARICEVPSMSPWSRAG
jgi:DNA-binding MarR family transcriptional regulator